MICIFCKEDKEEKSFSKEEHIISAAFGGKNKLPNGFVCDICNGELGKTIERDISTKSFISYLRTYIGPGNRGKLGENHSVRSWISLLKLENHIELLGFIMLGKPTMVPQFVIDLQNQNMQFFYNPFFSQEEQYNSFKNKLPITKQNSYIIDYFEKTEKIYIGFFEGKYYSYYHPDIKIEEHWNTINSKILNENTNIRIDESKSMEVKLTHGIGQKINIVNYFRAYSKMLFNCAAYFLGKKEILDDKYNKLRDWIRFGGKNVDEFILPQQIVNSFQKMLTLSFPKNSHKLILFSLNKNLIGIASFYGSEYPAAILLCKDFQSENYFNGLICDWENAKEKDETLLEYLNKIGAEAEIL
jgi:hypothetical protein